MAIQPKFDFDADSSKISSKEEVPLYNPNPKTDELNPDQKAQNVAKKILPQHEGAEGCALQPTREEGNTFQSNKGKSRILLKEQLMKEFLR